MLRSAFAVTLVVGAVSAVQVSAQASPTPPDHYALTNARIIVTPGQIIERGTVIVRDGRIAAVGEDVDIPATAIRVDASGHTVHAGLIDAASSIGLPSVTRQGGGRGDGDDGGQEVMPGREAADAWAPSAEELEALRAAGLTTLGLAFNGGILPGRVGAVHTGAGDARVLRAGVAQQVLLGRRRGEYPGTLMGAIAFVRQSFYDAQHEMRVRQAWEREPSGPRPAYSPDSRALEPAASGAMTVWLHGSSARDLDRALELAREIGARDYVIVGAQEGYQALDAIRAAARPVIVSLDFPSANQISGRAFELHVAPVSGEDEAEERADSAAVREARGNAGALARAGVRFALSSYGMSSVANLRAHVRAAIDAGLSPADALRALTVTPAQLLGIESMVGTIERGKLANLVVVSGTDPFAEDARVRDVFVEGVRYAIPEPEQREERDGARGAANVTGDFVGEIEGPDGLMRITLTISGSGTDLRGRITSEMGNVELTGRQDGADITLSGTFAPPGQPGLPISLTARVTGDELRGSITPQGMAEIPFTLRRRSPGTRLEVSR